MPPMETRSLLREDRRADFASGEPEIDEFLRRYAGQSQFRHHIGVTYCALAEGEIVAYATVSAGEIDPALLPNETGASLPAYPAPVLRLARVGVSSRIQGQGVGRELLQSAVDIAFEMRTRVGCVGIVVDAKPQSQEFYERSGFVVMPVTSRVAGAGAPPVRLFKTLKRSARVVAAARADHTPADSLAAEMRRRASELGLSADEVRSAVDRLLG
jgi:GNAT superfamily N-acetyltransferase